MIEPAENKLPDLIESRDIEGDLDKILEQNYIVLGVNKFEDEMRSKKPAIEFGEKIGASRILFNREFVEKRYKRPEYAAKRDAGSGSIMAKLPTGVSNYKKYEIINIYKYSVIYLRAPQT